MSEHDRPTHEPHEESNEESNAKPTDKPTDKPHASSDAETAEPSRTEDTHIGAEESSRGAADAEIRRLTDALARTQAEMVNHEKRLEREMDKARKFALERLMRDLIPVLDSLDQALAASGESDGRGDSHDDTAQQGLVLTRKLALKSLESHGLETIHPEGQRFDANWHEAMTAAPTDDAEPDTVLQVLQSGYALNGRLLRPARVIVAKAP